MSKRIELPESFGRLEVVKYVPKNGDCHLVAEVDFMAENGLYLRRCSYEEDIEWTMDLPQAIDHADLDGTEPMVITNSTAEFFKDFHFWVDYRNLAIEALERFFDAGHEIAVKNPARPRRKRPQ